MDARGKAAQDPNGSGLPPGPGVLAKWSGISCNCIVAVTAIIVLAGWFADEPKLVVFFPFSSPMAMTSAFAFLLLSLSGLLGGRRRTLRFLACCAAFMFGTVAFLSYMTPLRPVLDEVIVSGLAPSAWRRFSVRMSLISAIDFILLSGQGLLDRFLSGPVWRTIRQCILVAAISLCLASVIGLLYSIAFLKDLGFEKTIAVATSGNFLLLCLEGFLERPDEGIMRVILSRHAAGKMARRVLVFIFLIPVSVGAAAAAAVQRGMLEAAEAVLVIEIATILAFSALLIRNAAAIMGGEARLKESEERYRELFQHISSGVVVLGRDGADEELRLVDMNEAAENMRRMRRQEAMGKAFSEIFTCSGGGGSLRPLVEKAMESRLSQKLMDSPCSTEKGDAGWRNYAIYPLASGEIVILWDDISAQKKAEKEKRILESQLIQIQKMEALGRLAGGVAHDFNNILTVISGYSEILVSKVAEDLREQAREIHDAALKAADLTGQLLLFSRKQNIKPVVLNTSAAFEGMGKMLRRLIGEDIELEIRVEDGLGRILMDPGSFVQIIMNLAVNARDAMPAGGRLSIRALPVMPQDPACGPLGAVRIEVADTGQGMDASTLSSIFEPFFTTKPAGKGTGLGLSIVYGIVKQSGGTITASSEPGKGATFTIIVPCAEGEEGHGAAHPDRPGEKQLNPAVLLVEDDPAARMLLKKVLEIGGYPVIEARDGAEAIRTAGSRGGEIALVITDVIMPRMNGREMADRMREIRPGLPVIYVSGYTADLIENCGAMGRNERFVQKPFKVDELLSTVKQCIDSV